jgi:hypothetical protein
MIRALRAVGLEITIAPAPDTILHETLGTPW